MWRLKLLQFGGTFMKKQDTKLHVQEHIASTHLFRMRKATTRNDKF